MPAAASFEQTLNGSVVDGDSTTPRAIRVFARFDEESNAIKALLRAEEVEDPGSAIEWMADMTVRFGDNLTRALSRLRSSWEATASPRTRIAAWHHNPDGLTEPASPRNPVTCRNG